MKTVTDRIAALRSPEAREVIAQLNAFVAAGIHLDKVWNQAYAAKISGRILGEIAATGYPKGLPDFAEFTADSLISWRDAVLAALEDAEKGTDSSSDATPVERFLRASGFTPDDGDRRAWSKTLGADSDEDIAAAEAAGEKPNTGTRFTIIPVEGTKNPFPTEVTAPCTLQLCLDPNTEDEHYIALPMISVLAAESAVNGPTPAEKMQEKLR